MKRCYGCRPLLAGILVALAVTGCAGGKQAINTAPPKESVQSEATVRNMKVKAYYADSSLNKLIEREADISYSSESEKYKAALQLLSTAPDASVDPLSKGITIHSVSSKEGNVVIDLNIKDEGRLGAPGEYLLLEAFKKSMFQFSEVHSFDLLVDGQRTESLMGM